MCGSEYTDKMFLFLPMFYFDGFYCERKLKFHVSFVYWLAKHAFRILITGQLIEFGERMLGIINTWNNEGFDPIHT